MWPTVEVESKCAQGEVICPLPGDNRTRRSAGGVDTAPAKDDQYREVRSWMRQHERRAGAYLMAWIDRLRGRSPATPPTLGPLPADVGVPDPAEPLYAGALVFGPSRVSARAGRIAARPSGCVAGGCWPPKITSVRSVAFPDFLVGPMKERVASRSDDAEVFHLVTGCGPASAEHAAGLVRCCRKAAELGGLTPHELRHTAASLAVSQGASVLALQRMLGHDKPNTTLDFYAALFDDDPDDAVTGPVRPPLNSLRSGCGRGSGGPGRLREESRLTCMDVVPSAGHVEHGSGDDLWFSGGRLVVEADYEL